MAAIEHRLITCVGVDRGHDATLNSDTLIQDFSKRGEAIGGARAIGNHRIALAHIAVVHAEDDCALNVFRRGGDEHCFRATLKMDFCFVAIVELASTFEHHITAGPIEFSGIVGREHFHRTAA